MSQVPVIAAAKASSHETRQTTQQTQQADDGDMVVGVNEHRRSVDGPQAREGARAMAHTGVKLLAGLATVALTTGMAWPTTVTPAAQQSHGQPALVSDLPTDDLPADVRATLTAVDTDVAALRSGLATDAITPRVASLFSMDEAAVAAAPAPDTVRLDPATGGLPRDLQAPISILLAGVGQARALLGDLPVEEVEAFHGALAAGFTSWHERADAAPVLDEAAGPDGSGLVVQRQPVSPLEVGEPGPAVTRALQHNGQATLVIAQALDRALPALRAAAAARRDSPLAGTTAEGCDLHDARPLVCVGSEADNTHSADALLLVDLGGNDSHLAGSGTAPFLLPDGSAYVPVAVTVNLDGDDRYVASEFSLRPGGQLMATGSGAGYAGAVGILVDLAGDDTHEATAVLPPDEEVPDGAVPSAAAIAQGAGLIGTGLLFDDDGDDSYQASAESTDRPSSAGVLAQGAGAAGNIGSCIVMPSTTPPFTTRPSCSIGALVDRGGGNDRYELDGGRSDLPVAGFSWRMALGQGYGASTTGVLADDGGADTLRATTGVSTPALDAYADRRPTAMILAQGVGIGGDGLLLTGAGPTRYEAVAASSGMVSNYQVWAQGVGFVGVGILDDLGGDDHYTVTSEMAYDRALDVATHGAAARTITGQTGSVTNDVMAQGGSWTGAGVLRDHAGDDDYAAVSASPLVVNVIDDRDDGPPLALDVSSYTSSKLIAQGAAMGSGHGALLDMAGTDAYAARSLTPVSVTSTGTTTPQVTARNRFMSFIAAQAAGISEGDGVLADLDGIGDRFDVETSNAVDAPGATTFRAGNYWPPLQGAGGNSRLFALGEAPVLLAIPRNGICPASPSLRGFGTWVECSGGLPGTNPLSSPGREDIDSAAGLAVGQAPGAVGTGAKLTLEPGQLVADPRSDRVLVTVRLTDEAGAPLAGRLVHVNLQFSAPLVDVPLVQWWNWWQEDAVTAEDGTAEVSLPLDVSKLGVGNHYRLAASFDGDAERHPAHAASPYTLP